MTELRRNEAWATVFLTLKDPKTGSTLKVTIGRRAFDRLDLALEEGERVHVSGRAELYELKGELGLRATTIERIGLGGHLLALERLKQKLAAEGLFAPTRKRPLPRLPRAVGILTGADAAARGDLVATIGLRFPATKAVIYETRVQGKGAPAAIVAALRALAAHAEVDVDRARARGRELRGPSPFQRRGSRARGRRDLRSSGVSRGTRAGHAALRPGRRRSGSDTDCRGRARGAGGRRATCSARELAPRARQIGARAPRARRPRADATPRAARKWPRGSSSSGGGPASITQAPACRRSPPSRRWVADTRSSEREQLALRDASTVSPGDRLEIELASGGLGARVEDVEP